MVTMTSPTASPALAPGPPWSRARTYNPGCTPTCDAIAAVMGTVDMPVAGGEPAVGDQLVGHDRGQRRWDGEADPHAAAAGVAVGIGHGRDRRVDADECPGAVDQGTAGV